MSDYESDGDDNYDGDDGDDGDELQNLGPNNPANPANPANPVDPAFLLNEKKKEFMGSNHPKNNWIQCVFCGVFHPISMHLPNVAHCGQCWGFVNANQLNLIEGKYNGPNTIDEVKNFLKLTYPLHPSTCTTLECVYNKIKQLNEAKTLHYDFCVELGFVVENKNSGIVNNSNDPAKFKTEYNIKKKNKGYTRINFKSSSITI
jgi:hypothetical protein